MYFFDFIKSIAKKNNFGVLIWIIFNTIIVSGVLGYCFGSTATDYALGAIIYIVILAASLSPLGEAILRWQNGCKKITRKEYLDRIMPLFNEVYSKAKVADSKLPNDIQLYMIEDDSPNAFATGRKTICVTRGLLRYPDQEIKAVLAHEFGHLVHKDTDAILVVAVGNLIVSLIFLIWRIIFKAISLFVALLFGYISESFAAGFAAGLTKVFIDFLLYAAMQAWTKFGALLCLHSSRKNENLADKYSFDLGYGEFLCAFLDRLGPSNATGLWATLNSSHPDNDVRISYLQELGCVYRS